MSALPPNGGMVSIFTNRENVLKAIKGTQNVSIAAVNGPENVVITGTKEICNRISDEFESCGIEVRPLRVSHAFHSHLMEPILEEFRTTAKEVSYSPSKIEIISNLTGDIIKDENTSADYWVKHLRHTVEFEKGIQTLAKQNVYTFIEIGPKPVLTNLARQCLQENGHLWLASMKYGTDDWTCLLLSLKELYEKGFDINWKAFHEPFEYHKVSLPTYAFEKKPYYIYPPQAILEETSLESYFVKRCIKQDKNDLGGFISQKKYWLIFGEHSSFTNELSEKLRKRGDEYIIVMPGDTFRKSEES
jgi:acyl transferase domain-containing protein